MSAEAERWRVVAMRLRPKRLVEAGDALAAALEAERDRVRRMGEDHAEYRKNATAALEARDRRISELEAGLRRIADLDGIYDVDPGALLSRAERIARDLLAARAAGGEG